MVKINIREKTEVIAEIANAHQGSPEKAYKLALSFSRSGADAVKFQIYFADELLSKDHPRFLHFDKQSFKPETWNRIIENLKKKNIKIYCDVFGQKAFEIAKKNNVDGYKVHSSDLNNIHLLNSLSKIKKKIFLSTGGSTLSEISYAVNILRKSLIKPILLHGFQSYPTKIENCDLGRIGLLKKIFKDKCEYGYQDHVDAEDDFNLISPLIAISQGANYIEKHVTFNRNLKGVDYYSSLETDEFKKFINYIKKTNKLFNSSNYSFFKDEVKYRNQVKKIWFSNKNLKIGSYININDDLIMKRPKNSNIYSVNIEKIKKKKLIKSIKINHPINRSFFYNHVTAIIVARSNSKRLPNKSLKKICGIPTIEHLINRVKKSKKVNKIILCTTKNKEDLKLVKIAKKCKINFYKGENDDVLRRMIDSIKRIKTDIIIRITGDDILIDPNYLDLNIDFHLRKNLEYSNNKNLPGGCEVEIFDVELLKKIYFLAKDTSNTEYLTLYLEKYKDQFLTGSLKVPKIFKNRVSLTIDTKKDFKIVNKFLSLMEKKGKLFNYNLKDIFLFIKKNKNFFSKKEKKTNLKINTEFNWSKIVL